MRARSIRMEPAKAFPSLLWIAMAFFTLLASERPAHAYLDPGSGNMLVQMLVAAFAGALLSLRLFWSRIKIGILSLFSRPGDENEGDGSGPS